MEECDFSCSVFNKSMEYQDSVPQNFTHEWFVVFVFLSGLLVFYLLLGAFEGHGLVAT